MSRLKAFFNSSFKRQIFFLLLFVTLLLVIGGGTLTLKGFQARIQLDYEKQDEKQDEAINERLLNILTLAETTIDAVEKNEILNQAFSVTRKSNQIIYGQLYKESNLVRDFASVELYSDGNCIFSTNESGESEPLPVNYSILRNASESTGKTVYSIDPNNASVSGGDLLLAREIFTGYTSGVVVVRIEEDSLKDIISGQINSKDGFILANDQMRPFCQIGSAKDGVLLGQIRKNFLDNVLYTDNITSNVYLNDLGTSQLVSIYITPQPLEASAITAGYQIIGILAIISVIVCFILATGLSEYFSSPIIKLTSAMKRFRKGDFDTKIELNRSDEFEQLATGFNKMTTQLKETMAEQVAAERKINETRIAMMQAQLNPHFLYNTLDTIKWVAKANQVPEVGTLSASLASILRTSISEKQFCSLDKELKLVENYCEIQKIRFDDRFELHIDVAEEIKSAIVPKLILQPIVENAIVHGMEDMDDGVLVVTANRIGANLEVLVKDNGAGISDDMIEALESENLASLEGHLGMNNVNTIIKLYYGASFGISAKRLVEGGTEVKLLLPFKTEDE